MPYVEVEVQIDLDMLDEEDMVEFLEKKGYLVQKATEPKDRRSFAEKLFEKFSGDNSVPQFVKDFVYEHAGRIL